MRQGFFPGQLESLRELARDGLELHTYRRKSRRAFLALGLGAVVAGVGGFVVGRKAGLAAAAPPVDDPAQIDPRSRWQTKLAWAEEYAQRPIEDLVARRSTFLMTIEQTGGSEASWRGFARLAEHALAGAEPDHDLLMRLTEVSTVAPPPDWLAATLDRIRAELRPR